MLHCQFFLNIREGPAKKTDVLKLDMSGRFALNIVDNLIVVHHQASKVKNHAKYRLDSHMPFCVLLQIINW